MESQQQRLQVSEVADSLRAQLSHLSDEQLKHQYLNNLQWTNETGTSLRMDVIRDIGLSRTKSRWQTLEQIRRGDINELNTNYLSKRYQHSISYII